MSFVYEMVGEENRKLWESIGWKNWFAKLNCTPCQGHFELV